MNNPSLSGMLVLTLTDATGSDLNTNVEIRIHGDRDRLYWGSVNVGREVEIHSLPYGPLRIKINADGFEPLTRDLRIDDGSTELSIPLEVNSAEVVDIDAPEFSSLDPRLKLVLEKSKVTFPETRSSCSGEGLYLNLAPFSKATLLNTFSKSVATPLTIGGTVWDQFYRIRDVDERSVMFECSPTILKIGEKIEMLGRSGSVFGSRRPSGVFRTPDQAGSLQVAVFRDVKHSKTVASATILGAADADATPWKVREILIGEQKLNVNYQPLLKGGSTEPFPTRVVISAGSSEFPAVMILGGARPAGGGGGGGGADVDKPVGGSPKGDLKEAPPLYVNQGIIDGDDQDHAMDEPLRAGQVCAYWFEIARTIRKGGKPEKYEPPLELRTTDAEVQLQVTCSLFARKFISRTVQYRHDSGLEYQSFPFLTVPGQHELLVQVVRDSRPIYSKKWLLTVEEFAAGEQPPASAVEPAPADPAPSPNQSARTTERKTARLIADKVYAHRVALEKPGFKPFPGQPLPDFEKMTTYAAAARAILNRYAGSVSPHDFDMSENWHKTWTFLREMARWGSETAENVFGKRIQQGEFYGALDMLEDGSCLHIDSDPGSFPWDWLYLKEVPGKDAPKLGSPELESILNGFLGFRLRCDVLPAGDLDRRDVPEVLPNQNRTSVLSAVNVTADSDASPRNYDFVKYLVKQDLMEGDVCISGAETISALKARTKESLPLHLLYVYCHHSPGTQLNHLGFRNFGESKLYMKGKSDDPLSRIDLEDGGVVPFAKCAPLVLLNACGTALGGDYYPSGFIPYFTNKLNVPAVIGTVAEVETLAAYQFALDFIKGWLKDGTALDTVAEIRHRWLLQHGNPYGMFYAVYGNGHVRLQRSAGTIR